MKANDYMRLAKISLASRKKNTRSTVRGIAFGLIFIIPVLYIALGLYIELTSQINSAPELLSVQIVAGDERSGFEPLIGQYRNMNVPSSGNLDDVLAATDGEKYYFEQLITKQSYIDITASGAQNAGEDAFSFGVGGGLAEYRYISGATSSFKENKFAAVLDLEKTTGIKDGLLHSEKLDKRFGGIYVADMDKGFSGDGKGQVIVSELFLHKLGMTATSAYGKKITLEFTDLYTPASGGGGQTDGSELLESFDIKLFNGYEVVGVIKSEVTQSALLERNRYSTESYLLEFMENAVFLSSASRDIGGGRALEPVMSEFDRTNYFADFGAAYPDDYAQYNDEYIGSGVNDFTSLRIFAKTNENYRTDYFATPTATLLIDVKDYAQLDRVVGQVSAALSSVYPEGTREAVMSNHATGTYSTFNMMYFFFSFIILIMGVFGAVVFFSAMVNLFNSIAHSVDIRKHYLGVMRAIGAPGSMIAKLYMAESITIFRRAAVWIAIFATAVCVGLWLIVNSLFAYLNEHLASMFTVKLSISIFYAPLVILASLAVLVLIGGLFSYFLSRNVASKPITSILTD